MTSLGISKENKNILKFLFKFLLIFLTLFFIIEIINLSFLNNFLSEKVAKIFNLNYAENIIFGGEVNFIITNFCTGLVSISILAGIIFSFKKPIMTNKIIFFVLGALILLIANFFRIIFVILMASVGFDAELVHTITWFLMSFIILVFWFYGNKKLLGYKNLNQLIN